jgi:hypothetical protein
MLFSVSARDFRDVYVLDCLNKLVLKFHGSYKTCRLLGKFNIKAVHIPCKKSFDVLRLAEDDLGLKVSGVCNILCECGNVYI